MKFHLRKASPVLMAAVIILSMAGCEKKTAITNDEFTNCLEEKGFAVTDGADQVQKTANSVSIAVSPDSAYQLEFYIMSTIADTELLFGSNKELFEDSFNGNTAFVSVGNASSYSVTSGSTFAYISRVDNTFLYLVADSTHKDEIKAIISELGY